MFFFTDGQIRDYRANGLKVGNAMTTVFPLVREETGEAFEATVYDYFDRYSPYHVRIKYPM